MNRLSIEEIKEITGERDPAKILDLEILFTQIFEIDFLDYCPNLEKLYMINNSLLSISNLVPVQSTLRTLCLCNQQLTSLESLNLPVLEELFLHNNLIERMTGLQRTPSLRKLWLSNNKINVINSLENCLFLQECLLHGNSITSIRGFESNHQLQVLGLSANPVVDLYEVDRLENLAELRHLTFYDIHFGKCPITDQDGYTEYILLSLNQLDSLDGVAITKSRLQAAENKLANMRQILNESLQQIDEDYEAAIAEIGERTAHLQEIRCNIEYHAKSALEDLSKCVADSMEQIASQIKYQECQLSTNYEMFHRQIDQQARHCQSALQSAIDRMQTDYDLASSLICLSDRMARTEFALIEKFNQFHQIQILNNQHNKLLRDAFLYEEIPTFQPISRHSPLFRKISHNFSFHRENDPESIPFSFRRKVGSYTQIITNGKPNSMNLFLRNELIRIYQVNLAVNERVYSSTESKNLAHTPTKSSDVENKTFTAPTYMNAFTIVSIETLMKLLQTIEAVSEHSDDYSSELVESFKHSNSSPGTSEEYGNATNVHSVHDRSYVFFSNPDVASSIFLANGNSFDEMDNYEQHVSSLPGTSELFMNTNELMRPHLNNALQKKIQLLLCCQLEVDIVFPKKHSTRSPGQSKKVDRKLIIPTSLSGKADLLSEIYSTSKPVKISVEVDFNPLPSQFAPLPALSSPSNRLSIPSSTLPNLNPSSKLPRVPADMFVLPQSSLLKAVTDKLFSIHFLGLILAPTYYEGFDKLELKLQQLLESLSADSRELVHQLHGSLRACYRSFLERMQRDAMTVTLSAAGPNNTNSAGITFAQRVIQINPPTQFSDDKTATIVTDKYEHPYSHISNRKERESRVAYTSQGSQLRLRSVSVGRKAVANSTEKINSNTVGNSIYNRVSNGDGRRSRSSSRARGQTSASFESEQATVEVAFDKTSFNRGTHSLLESVKMKKSKS